MKRVTIDALTVLACRVPFVNFGELNSSIVEIANSVAVTMCALTTTPGDVRCWGDRRYEKKEKQKQTA